MRKISKIIGICFLLMAVPLFAGCESEETRHDKIRALIDDICENGETTDNLNNLKKYRSDTYLAECSMEVIKEKARDNQYLAIASLLSAFESVSLQNEDIRNVLVTTITDKQQELLASDDFHDIYNCLRVGHTFDSLDYYTENTDLIPVNDIIDYARDHGEKIITRDQPESYYYSKKDEYTDSTGRWYDPLAEKYLSRGEIGTYRYKVRYKFYGDIIAVIELQEWWTHDGSVNGANTSSTEYWYKDNYRFSNNNIADSLLDGEGYFFGSGNDFSLIVISKDELILMSQDGTLTYNR